jgi:hypothetical protein
MPLELIIMKKAEQNKSKIYFSKSVQNTHFARVTIKYHTTHVAINNEYN